jgi:hypothetical protein
MTHHAEAEAEDHALESFDQQASCLMIAGLERPDQRTVVHRQNAFARHPGHPRLLW